MNLRQRGVKGAMSMTQHTMNPVVEIGEYQSGQHQPVAVSCACGWVRRFHRSADSDWNEGNRLWVEHLEGLTVDNNESP
jgi:hypothetical protein